MTDPSGGIRNIGPTYPVTPVRRPRKDSELENDQQRTPAEKRERRDDSRDDDDRDDNHPRIDERA